MAKLFTLKKNPKQGVCHANRCKETEGLSKAPGDLWGREEVELCERHLAQAVKAAESGVQPQPREQSATEKEAALSAEMAQEHASGKELLELSKGFVPKTQEDLEFVNKMLQDVKGNLKALEAQEKGITVPLTTALNRTRALFRPVKTVLADVELRLKRIIKTARLLQDDNNRKALAEAAERHAAGDAEGHAAALAKVQTVTDLQGTSITTKWLYEIEDESKLPREFLKPNETLIKEHCAHSTSKEPTPIPGVRFYPDATVRSSATEPAE